MRYSTFQDIWKLPDQIRADLGTPLIQGLLDTISKLLAVRGRAFLPQAAPVQQVPRLQVQGAGPRQQRPGRAAVGAHGSGRPKGPGGDGVAGEEGGRPAGRCARGGRAEREAAGPTRRDLGLRSGPREAGRWRSGGPGGTRWRLLLLRLPPQS